MAQNQTQGRFSSPGFPIDHRTMPWAQYPLDDSFASNYYSNLLTDLQISSSAEDSIPGLLNYPKSAGLEADYSRPQNVSRERVDVQFSREAAATSSSGGSLNSPAKSIKEAELGKKRAQKDIEDMEWQSEPSEELGSDVTNAGSIWIAVAPGALYKCTVPELWETQEDSGDNSKLPSTGRSSSKRSRAAQVHNLSEKRRRNRINEKMKALQKLIPNSNKQVNECGLSFQEQGSYFTCSFMINISLLVCANMMKCQMNLSIMDMLGIQIIFVPVPSSYLRGLLFSLLFWQTDKASMLDEAIDYLKQLQLQVQMLSARSGIDVLPMRMLSGVPQLQMQQMPQTCMNAGHAGIGLTMGMGTGIVNMTQGTAVQPFLSLHGPYPRGLRHMNMLNTSTTGTDAHGGMQVSCEVDRSQVNLPLLEVPSSSQEMYTGFFLQQQR
eukprot:Gb_09709 [translate_table: standard]